MISKPLFRVNDLVTLREDIDHDMDVRYRMIHDPNRCTIFIPDIPYCDTGNLIKIGTVITKYRCTRNRCVITDEMFREGERLMRYLNYLDEPEPQFGYSLLDTVYGRTGETAEYVLTATYSPWRYPFDDWYAIDLDTVDGNA